jgi:hypothetical protein
MNTLAFMNVLENLIALANLGSGVRVDRVAQIRHNRFAHLLLLCNRCYPEFAWLLLRERKRRLLGFLGICLAVHTVPTSRQQKQSASTEGNCPTQLSTGECPPIGIARLLQRKSILFCRRG